MIKQLRKIITEKHELLKYIISGGTATVVDLAALYFFKDVLHMWYVTGGVLAFIVAFVVSFSLQKYWTFKDHSRDKIREQLSLYLLTQLFNLLVNTFFLYIFVDHFHVWYLLAQVTTSGLIAIGSYFIFKYIIFKNRV